MSPPNLEVEPARRSRVPDFFVVGQPKSGTTALHAMLRQHPQVFMPDLKEPMFLATDLRPRLVRPGKGTGPRSMDEYLALFEGGRPDQRLGEASTLYLFSRTAAGSIASLNPGARVIAIFREPAAFLHSLHLQHRQDHQENQRDLRRAMRLEVARAQGRRIPRRAYRPQDLQYSEHVRYTEQLSRYHAVFAPSQVLTLIHDDYRRDNAATVRQVLGFLGVAETAPLAAVEANPAVAVRSQLLDDTVHRFSVGRGPFSRAVKGTAKVVLSQPVRRRLLGSVRANVVHAPPPAPDDELMTELRLRLKPEVERFSEYVGRDLVALWGYDRV